MTTEEVKKRMEQLRHSLDLQIVISYNDKTEDLLAITQSEAELIIGLIDTVLRWDYEINF